MSQAHLFALSGVALFAIGVLGVLAHRNLLRRIIGVNVAASGTFLVFIGFAARGAPPDPVPHAVVLTGLVVGVASTALALALAVRLHHETGRPEIPDDDRGEGS